MFSFSLVPRLGPRPSLCHSLPPDLHTTHQLTSSLVVRVFHLQPDGLPPEVDVGKAPQRGGVLCAPQRSGPHWLNIGFGSNAYKRAELSTPQARVLFFSK